MRELLKDHFLISSINQSAQNAVFNEFVLENFAKNDTIFKENEVLDSVHVIDEGTCLYKTKQNNHDISLELGPGSIFGDLSLIEGTHKVIANVTAGTDVIMWKLEGRTFRYLAQQNASTDNSSENVFRLHQ